MPTEIIEGMMAITAFAVIGSFTLAAMRLRFRHKEVHMTSARPEELDRLADSVEELAEQVGRLTVETAELQERLDFTERLLTRAEDPSVPIVTPNP